MSTPATYERFRQLNVCVLIPTYNNGGTLQGVLDSVLRYTDQVIVVNDGATDNTGEILKAYPQVHLVSYERNAGKGWALRQGFKSALACGLD
jgi:glycosyltransferase involved in cell wall biosynthesis